MSKRHRRQIYELTQERIWSDHHDRWWKSLTQEERNAIDRSVREDQRMQDEWDRQAIADLDGGRDDEDDYPPDHPDRIAEEEYQRMQRLG